MRIIFILFAATLTLLTLASCQKESVNSGNETHTVNFIAGEPTKTTYEVQDETSVIYTWTDNDVNRFSVYENGEEATSVTATLTSGLMHITATFDGDVPASPQYQAVFNSGVSTTQTSGSTYDQDSDVLISDVLSSGRSTDMLFRFKREVAFAEMTLMGLPAGNLIRKVIISSDAPLAGTYDKENGFSSTKNEITVNTSEVVDQSGNVTLKLVTIPFTDKYLTITAITYAVGSPSAPVAYTKTFTKSISFTQGDVMAFKVNLSGCGNNWLFYESFDGNNGTGGNDGLWTGEIANLDPIVYDYNESFTLVQRVYGANHCARIGDKTDKGDKEGSLQTSSIALSSSATLKFNAGSWAGKNTKLTLSLVSGTATLSQNQFDLSDSQFNEYTVTITNPSSDIQLKFTGDKQFFLDEIRLY